MIMPISTGTPVADLALSTSAGTGGAPQDQHVAQALPSGSSDALARLVELLGPPPHAQAQHTRNGFKGNPTPATKTADLTGTALPGQKGVLIQRELGDPKGYETKNHALAFARAAGSDTAMVVQDGNKRWHAVETNKVGQDATAAKGKLLAAVQVGKVDQATYDTLRKEAMAGNDPSKWKTFAAYALGVPEAEINIVRKGDTPSLDHININLSPDFNAEGKTSGFHPKNPPAVQLGPAAFDRPANAMATLAHEEVHADHHRMTARLFAEYSAQTKQPSNAGFREWAYTKLKDVRVADIAGGYQDGKANAATELEAHVEAARVAFLSGDLAQAKVDLQKVASLPNVPLRQTQDHSIETLKQLKGSLTGAALDVFNEVVSKAKMSPVLKGL